MSVKCFMFVLKILLEAVTGSLKYDDLKCARSANEMIPDQFTLFPGR